MREIRRGVDRATTRGAGITSHHSFSYGAHYDPDNIAFGPLMAINTEIIDAGAGYGQHQHQDVDIVTWVLEGELQHTDSAGNSGLIGPHTAQRLSAGRGVEHTEVNASARERLVFVQMMLVSEHADDPCYAQVDVVPVPGALTSTVEVRAPAQLFVLRLDPGQTATVPAAPRSLAHITRGRVAWGDATLTAGDEARLTGDGEYDLSAADGSSEILIWQLQR